MDNRLVFAVALMIGCLALAVKGLKISSNITVGELKTPIRRETCGKMKICVETPTGCDPNGNDACLFTSATAATPVMGRKSNVAFQLRGDSDGYIVLILSADMNKGGNDDAFVCAQYNNTLHFFTATFNNETLTVNNRTQAVSNVLASLESNVIRCTFTALGLNATANGGSSDHSFYIFMGNGSIVNGTLGKPTITFIGNRSEDLTSLPPQGSNNINIPANNMNISVGILNTPIRRETCGKMKICVETPTGCDPNGNDACLFTSATAATPVMGRKSNVAFQLRGDSDGYIVLILSADMNKGGNDDAFVCAQYNNTIRFFTATFNNETLTVNNRTQAVSNVLASLESNVIRCTFTALGLNATANGGSSDHSFYIFMGNGSIVNGTLGKPTITFIGNRSEDLTSLPPQGSNNMNIPVGILNAIIGRDTCGRTKVCEEVPADCDPRGNGTCLFISATSVTTRMGTNVAIQMRGNSMGFLFLILSTNETLEASDDAFVCAQNNNTFQFFTANLNNDTLIVNNRAETVSNVRASHKFNVIRCTFIALGLNATSMAGRNDTRFFIFAGNGTFINGTLGKPIIMLRSTGSVDLTGTTNTAGGRGGLHLTSLALLALLSALISHVI